MKSTITSGHSTNLVSLRSLVPCAQSYGVKYNPSKGTIKITALQTLISEGENVLELVTSLEVANMNAIDARDKAFKLFIVLLASINSIVKSSDTSKEERAHVNALIRLIRGTKLTPKKTDPVNPEPGVETTNSNEVTSHTMGYDIRLENFDKLIQYLTSVPAYTPNEPELTIAGLTDCYSDLKSKNASVASSDIQLTKARNSRMTVFYTPSTGLAIAGQEAKSYIKGVFGAKSPEYKQVSKLKFRIYKK